MADGNNVIAYLEAGLRVSGLRGRVIADNIANLETPGFRRRAVRFEKLLAEALDGASDVELGELKARVFQPRTTPVNARGNDVSLDVEVGQMIQNGARYKTYLRVLTRLYRQMEMAMGGQP